MNPTIPRPWISVVVPVYYGAACLEELHRRVQDAVEPLDPIFELILVDDCSPDDSWAIIESLARRHRAVRGVRFTRNFGQQSAITAGLEFACGEWVVIMDCDLQDRPEEIPRLLRAVQDGGFDVAIARRGRRSDTGYRVVASRLFYSILGLLTKRDFDPQEGSFRVISSRVVRELLGFREKIRLFGEMVRWLGYPTTTVDVEHGRSARGQSSYSLAKLMRLAFEILLVESDRMLRYAMLGGLATSVWALALGFFILIQSLTHRSTVEGWTSLIVSVSFFSGVILSTLALIGLQISKLHQEIRNRPLYVVRSVLDTSSHGEGERGDP